MTLTLTADQRWLLATMGGWPIVWALCGPEGTKHLMDSQWGGTGKRIEGAPEWMTSFETQRGKVHSPTLLDSRVVVSAAQIDRFAAQLPPEIKAELQACQRAGIEENQRAYCWCYCGRENKCLSGGRHHPTDVEDQDHLHKVWGIQDWQDAIIAKALGLKCDPVGQLDLFAGVSA